MIFCGLASKSCFHYYCNSEIWQNEVNLFTRYFSLVTGYFLHFTRYSLLYARRGLCFLHPLKSKKKTNFYHFDCKCKFEINLGKSVTRSYYNGIK